jgi:cellulose biosynthesis protein BcsQ
MAKEKEKLIRKLPQDRIDASKVITIANHKGGCGKTTTAISLGMYYVRNGLNVLFIDVDPQHNLTTRMGIDDDTLQDERIEAVLLNSYKSKSEKRQTKYSRLLEYPYIYRANTDTVTKIGEIGILPGAVSVDSAALAARSKLGGRNTAPSLNEYFKNCIDEYRNYYDRIIIDTAPSLTKNLMTTAAMWVSDEIICPIDGAEAALGLVQFVTWVDRDCGFTANNLDDRPGILFALVKYYEDPESVIGSASTDTLVNSVHQLLKYTFGDSVCNSGVLERPSLKRTLTIFGRKSDYDDLCAEIDGLITLGRTNNPYNTKGTEWDRLNYGLNQIVINSRRNKIPEPFRPVYENLNGG